MKAEVFVLLRYGMSSSRCFETTSWYHLQIVAEQVVSNTLKMGTESVSKRSENLPTMTRHTVCMNIKTAQTTFHDYHMKQ